MQVGSQQATTPMGTGSKPKGDMSDKVKDIHRRFCANMTAKDWNRAAEEYCDEESQFLPPDCNGQRIVGKEAIKNFLRDWLGKYKPVKVEMDVDGGDIMDMGNGYIYHLTSWSQTMEDGKTNKGTCGALLKMKGDKLVMCRDIFNM